MVLLEYEYQALRNAAIKQFSKQYPNVNVENLMKESWNMLLDIPIFSLDATELKNIPKKVARYIPTTEVAKLIRKELKEHFPGIKFSVRSKKYSGGSSINVDWTDGPATNSVDSIIQKFAGAIFDGMIDLKEYNGPTEYQGELVRFGVDFIFANRKYSDEKFIEKANEICKNWGYNEVFNNLNDICNSNIRIGEYYLRDYTYQKLYKLNF